MECKVVHLSLLAQKQDGQIISKTLAGLDRICSLSRNDGSSRYRVEGLTFCPLTRWQVEADEEAKEGRKGP